MKFSGLNNKVYSRVWIWSRYDTVQVKDVSGNETPLSNFKSQVIRNYIREQAFHRSRIMLPLYAN